MLTTILLISLSLFLLFNFIESVQDEYVVDNSKKEKNMWFKKNKINEATMSNEATNDLLKSVFQYITKRLDNETYHSRFGMDFVSLRETRAWNTLTFILKELKQEFCSHDFQIKTFKCKCCDKIVNNEEKKCN